jgi:hypothetical protein
MTGESCSEHLAPVGSDPTGYHRRVADQDGKSLDQRLEEIGTQLAWVRDYL